MPGLVGSETPVCSSMYVHIVHSAIINFSVLGTHLYIQVFVSSQF